jgi:hypothetical protein
MFVDQAFGRRQIAQIDLGCHHDLCRDGIEHRKSPRAASSNNRRRNGGTGAASAAADIPAGRSTRDVGPRSFHAN